MFAKQLLYSLDHAGKVVFPDFKTGWHFDDKVGQKYLFESINAPAVPSYVFYSKKDALIWVKETSFPKVFKLRNGAGSENVRLVKTRREAKRLINKAFGSGIKQYHAWSSLKERWRKYRNGLEKFDEVYKGLVRFLIPPRFTVIIGKAKGYIYFQDFIANNKLDIRITVLNNKCFASRRYVRSGDFRASGSGIADFDMSKVPQEALKISFDIKNKLDAQCLAFDYVMDQDKPRIVEMSYAFGYDIRQFIHGYWDEDFNFYEGEFDPFAWMVDGVIDKIRNKSKNLTY